VSARAKRPWLALSLCTLLAWLGLMGLGFWQIQRLQWKEALLTRLHARINAPPIPLAAAAQWDQWSSDDYDYRHVVVSGSFEHDKEVRLFGAGRDKQGLTQTGAFIITPLRLSDGHVLLVNRGFVPLALEDPRSRPQSLVEGPQTLTGLLRAPEARNLFTPADEPAHRLWFSRDPRAMATALGLEHAAPFSLDADASPDAVLAGGATLLAIANNHLAYAFTWFGLATTLLVVYALFMWRRFGAAADKTSC
jgi:surfeit locus 1 family protein